ncbi:fam-a protein [Plasmodium berghei]|uniref:Fam-a protein n=1 Tax=Plasmodium berghei TaxID=5821 RepID=A0A0Y9TH30_PLABE|nr:fam-a protein [Plasmodium berghei]
MNKFYIQFVLFLLTISLYVNNKTLASDPAPGTSTTPESTHHYPTSEVYEKNKHLLSTDPEETINAEKHMEEIVEYFYRHVIGAYGLKDSREKKNKLGWMYGFKKNYQDNRYIERIHYRPYYDSNHRPKYIPNMHDQITSMLWDPDCKKPFNDGSFKISRVYNPNLVMIQQRYGGSSMNSQKYFYALAAYVEKSKRKSMIVMAIVDINDPNPSNKEYKDAIIKNANLLKTTIDSEDHIRQGKLEKPFVNIAGYFIDEFSSTDFNIVYAKSFDKNAPDVLDNPDVLGALGALNCSKASYSLDVSGITDALDGSKAPAPKKKSCFLCC